MSLDITKIEIRKLDNPKSKVLAFADMIIGDALCIKNIKIINGKNGLFVGMPSVQDTKTKTFRDIVYPINSDARKEITEAIMKEYNDSEDVI